MNNLIPVKRNNSLGQSFFELPTLETFFDNSFLNNWMVENRTPSVNVIDNEKEYLIDVATPGFKKTDFNIELDGDKLDISGKSSMEHEENEKNYRKREFSYSSFRRTFPLPKNVNADNISANYVDGVLKISIPKYEVKEISNKRIEIK